MGAVGPGFLWMVSAAGSGELLFTPRVGAMYGYAFLWALLAAVLFKWFINREIGRFAVCTGTPVLEGFARGPGAWALVAIVGPQLVVAVASIAGLAASAATALAMVLPGDLRLWMAACVVTPAMLVLWGRYRGVERAATVLALGLALAALVTASRVPPPPAALARGLVPRVPAGTDVGEILPWLGFMLSGAAGLMWYSYWVRAKGWGAASLRDADDPPIDPGTLTPEDRARLRGWIGQMTTDATVAVVGTLLVTVAFLVLGAELLRPRGLVPDEDRIAAVLGRLLGEVWGPFGFWFMVVGVFVGFWDTVLSDQDGHSRLFANGTRLLATAVRPGLVMDEARLRPMFTIVLVTVLPIALYLAIGQPVVLLKAAGMIEAAHIPVVTGLVLHMNRRLPPELRPSPSSVALTAIAGMFFAGFAAAFLVTQLR